MSHRKRIIMTWVLATAMVFLVVGFAAEYSQAHEAVSPRRATSSNAAPAPGASDDSEGRPHQEPAAKIAPAMTAESRDVVQAFSDAFKQAAATVNPSVVPILSEHKVDMSQGLAGLFGDPFFQRFFGRPMMPEGEQIQRSLGSGVIVSDDGYILTNNHVVEHADKLVVITDDQKRVPAHVVGTDPESDLAVIKIDEKNLPAATLGNSDELQVGQWVIAVGNPLEMLHSVTAGIISATGRSSVGLADFEDFIQTDASINPGNSGGALADLDGRVIGINTAIASPSGGNVGVGFAIPINMARRIMQDLIENGKITRGYAGLYLQDMTDDLAKAMGLKQAKGVLVGDVVQDGPADHAGFRTGDVIVDFDGKAVEGGAQIRNLVASKSPGAVVDFGVIRDGRKIDLTVTLGERPASESESPSGGSSAEPSENLGLSVRDLTPELAQHFGYQNAHGVLVTSVEPGGPADEAGLRPGDLIESAAGQHVTSVHDLRQAISGIKSGDRVAFLVRRGANTMFVALRVP